MRDVDSDGEATFGLEWRGWYSIQRNIWSAHQYKLDGLSVGRRFDWRQADI